MIDQPRMSDEQLLPCPFCGEQPEPPVFVDDAYYSISCSDCSARVPYGTSEQDAKTQWNMRSNKALEKSQARVVELQNSFDLRWKADMRAIKKWRKENPGNDLVRPDHADLCVWLLAKLERVEGKSKAIRANIERMATQQESFEMDDDMLSVSDFEDGYNRMVRQAKWTLLPLNQLDEALKDSSDG